MTTVVFYSIFLLFVNFPWISTVRVVQHSYAQAGLGILLKEQQILSKNLCLQNFAPRIRWKKAPRKYFKIIFFLLSSLYMIEMKCDFVQRCRKKLCIVWSQIHGGSHVKKWANDPKNPLKMRFLGFLSWNTHFYMLDGEDSEPWLNRLCHTRRKKSWNWNFGNEPIYWVWTLKIKDLEKNQIQSSKLLLKTLLLGHSTGLANMIKTLQTNYGFLRQKQIMTYSCIYDRFIMFSLQRCQSDFYNLKWILHSGSNSWEIINLQMSKLTPSCVFWCRF